MSKDEDQARTFNEEQQTMFQISEENQGADATRPRTPGVQTDPVIPGTGVAGSEEGRDEKDSNKS